MRALLNTKMTEGTLVRDHILKMIAHLNELEILGAEIDDESQVNIVLMSLLESFNNFCLTYCKKIRLQVMLCYLCAWLSQLIH